jgi:dTDP-4-amino-4,6-dideoxygalactose transaminase
VHSFESEFGGVVGAKEAVGTGNGMDALEIGLRALSIGPGDEVITTPLTAFATVLSIIRAGATPVLGEIDKNTGLLDPEAAEELVSPRTKALILVHLFGHVAKMDQWEAFSRKHQVHLIEDCAQSHLAAWRGRSAGTFGTFGAFSFYPTKNLGAVGDGGALVTNDSEIAAAARSLRNYGQSDRYHHVKIGLNSRLDELQAAMLRIKLRQLAAETEARRTIAQSYYGGIKSQWVHPLGKPETPGGHAYHLFPITCRYRSELIAHLQKEGIETLIHYPVPANLQEAWRDAGLKSVSLPIAENLSTEVLSIPCRPGLATKDVSRIINAINSFVPKRSVNEVKSVLD